MASPEPAIAYVLGTFPQPSQTFIAREIRGLIAIGVPLQIFALRRRPATALETPDREWFERVRFAPRAFMPATLSANAWWWKRDAGVYWRALRTLLALPFRPRAMRVRAVILFARAAWIAREIEQNGGCRQVHAHFALAQTEVAMVVSLLLNRPFSFTAHARDIYATPSALPEKMRAARLVVTCTAYNRDYLQRLCPDVPADRVRLVYHGVDDTRATSAGLADPPLLLAAGRLIEKKGFDDLLAACAELRDRGLRFRCCIAGDGPLRASLVRTIRQLKLDAIVELPGWQPADTVSALMQTAAAIVVPSRISSRGDRDGIPNVVLEAMAAGRAVVATDVSGIPEAVRDGISGVLVPPGDPGALANALAQIVSDPPRTAAMGAAGRTHAVEEFAIPKSAGRLAELFHS